MTAVPLADASDAGYSYKTKSAARSAVWDRLEAGQAVLEPFPVKGRIPHFVGARAAAVRLFEVSPWREARALKVNPDTPQRAVRLLGLQRGVRIYVPTPRLAGGFWLLDPARIPPVFYGAAASRATMMRWAVPVSLEQLPAFDGIVAGSVAVTATGRRCGKGAGYSDLESGLLRELGHLPVPVATTVHDLQFVGDFPVDATDQQLQLICTPTRTVRTLADPAGGGIVWSRIDAAALAAMPMLAALRARVGVPEASNGPGGGGTR